MVSKFFGVLSVIALAGSSMAGIVSYANAPYTTAYNALNAPGHAITYASHAPIYQHQQPLVYHHAAAPVLPNQRILAATPTAYYAAPQHYIKSVAASPLITKTLVASAPVAAAVPVLKQLEFESSPRYDFSYGVHDSITGDIKSQVETRDGGNVQGAYSVVDADGYKRTVTYTADDFNGFNAVVQREPIVAKFTTVANAPLIKTAPVVTADAPVIAAATAPLQHVVPVQQQYHYVPEAHLQQLVYGQQQQLQQQQLFVPQQQYGLQQQYGFQQLAQAEQQPEAQQEQSLQQPQEQAEQQNEQQQIQHYPQQQQFPPQYPQYEQPEINQENFAQQQAQPEHESANDDSDVIEARSATNTKAEQGHERSQRQSHIPQTEQQQPSFTTAAPAPITEEDQEKPAASA